MSGHEPKMPDDSDITFPSSSLWGKMPIIGAVVGVAGLGAGLSQLGAHQNYVAHSYLFAFCAVLSIPLGALCFVLIQHLVRAGWSVVVRRVAEHAAWTVPLFALLFIPIFFWTHDLYHWTHVEQHDKILAHKAPYLNTGFWDIRAVVYFGIWIALAWFVRSTSMKMDAGGDVKKHVHALWKIAPIGIILYAFSQTFASFDWLMSLQPHWYSTMFGVYFFAGSMLGAYSFFVLVTLGLQKAGVMKQSVNTEHFHDLGKFVFGHTIFWAYIAFSQFMLIWYAGIPEEVEFFYHRAHPEHGWATISYALPIMNFFIPFFFLLSRHVKRHRVGLAVGSAYAFVVHIIDVYWLVMPMAEGGKTHFPGHLLWVDVALWVGMFGLFFALFTFWLSKSKLIPVGDPRLMESLGHENY
jgi:hypothetical protein